jgi:hypothetical protein
VKIAGAYRHDWPERQEESMRTTILWLYRGLTVLFFAGVVVEFFFAGLGVFYTQRDATTTGTLLTQSTFEHNFNPHLLLGDILFGISLLLIVAALAAGLGRRAVLIAVGLFGLLAVQATFAFSGPADLRALHPVLALLILGAAVALPLRAFRTHHVGAPPSASARGELEL